MQYSLKADTRSLYIHWPFCPYRCHFCPFVALASHDQFMEQYHRALCKEIQEFARTQTAPAEIDTIFFGGGTPSTYPNNLLEELFVVLHQSFKISPTAEITIEVNPGTVDKEKLLVWQKLGINRISIGVQGLNDTVLKNLNRHQSAQDVYDLLQHAQGMFDVMSVDLILGLPGVSEQEWQELIQKVVAWPIQHVSTYFLTIHEQTPLYYKVKKKQVALPADEQMVDMYNWTVAAFAAAGLQQYEISNFARAGFESRHNSVYWERKPYKGFGIGACSFDGMHRFQNEKNIMNYMQQVERGGNITLFSESLTSEQIHLEKIMLGLRRVTGVSFATLIEHVAPEKLGVFKEQLIWLKDNHFIEEVGDRWRLTLSGLAVENEVVVRLT